MTPKTRRWLTFFILAALLALALSFVPWWSVGAAAAGA